MRCIRAGLLPRAGKNSKVELVWGQLLVMRAAGVSIELEFSFVPINNFNISPVSLNLLLRGHVSKHQLIYIMNCGYSEAFMNQ